MSEHGNFVLQSKPLSYQYYAANLPFSLYIRYIQGVRRLVDITAGGDFLGLCGQKSSYKNV